MSHLNITDKNGNPLGTLDESKPLGEDLTISEEWQQRQPGDAAELETEEARKKAKKAPRKSRSKRWVTY